MALDDGRILYIGRYGFIFDDSANGGRAETTATVDSLNVYDPASGTVERVWDAAKFWDAADPAQRVARSENIGVLNWTHVNSVSRAPDGGYIASVRNRRQIISISPDFQTIRWQLGGPDSDFAFPAPTDRFDMQRAAAQLQNGNVLVFDNRAVLPDESGGYYSRALELRLDFDEMTAVKTWEFTPNPPLYAPVGSSAYRLDNGSTLINFGLSVAPATVPIAIIEADADGREIFRLETIDPSAEAANGSPRRCRAYPGPESVIGETTLRAPKPMP